MKMLAEYLEHALNFERACRPTNRIQNSRPILNVKPHTIGSYRQSGRKSPGRSRLAAIRLRLSLARAGPCLRCEDSWSGHSNIRIGS
jgi:hypothetical protein